MTTNTPERLTREERKRRTRAELLASGAEVFARDGFAGARVEEIAAGAGVTTGALYSHFAGKEALFLAVYEEYAAMRARELDEVSDGRRRAGADQWMARFDAQPSGLRLHFEFAEHARRDPNLREDFALRVGAVRGAIAHLLEREAAASGRELPMSIESLAAVIRALGIGLAAERMIDPNAVPAELFGDFIEVLYGHLFGEERAA